MYRNSLCQKLLTLTILAGFAMVSDAVGQQQPAALMAGMANNGRQLRQYTFKQRTETYHKGELKNAKVDEVHYSTAGERVSVSLDEKRADSEPRRRGPGSRLIARKIEQEQDKMKDYIERLMSLASRYLDSDPAKLQAAMANAEVTTGGGSNQVRIRMRNFVRSGDSMTMSFDPETRRPTRTEVNTSLDEAPVTISLVFDQVRDGPSYPGRTVVKSEAKELEVRVLTYDYRL